MYLFLWVVVASLTRVSQAVRYISNIINHPVAIAVLMSVDVELCSKSPNLLVNSCTARHAAEVEFGMRIPHGGYTGSLSLCLSTIDELGTG